MPKSFPMLQADVVVYGIAVMLYSSPTFQADDEEALADEGAEALRLQRAAAEALRPEDCGLDGAEGEATDNEDVEDATVAAPETLGQAAARVRASRVLGARPPHAQPYEALVALQCGRPSEGCLHSKLCYFPCSSASANNSPRRNAPLQSACSAVHGMGGAHQHHVQGGHAAE